MINYTLASPDNPQDDAVLRELMRLQGMSGWVDLSLEREPSFFTKQWPDMPEYAVIARDEDVAVGMYTYGIHPVYVNGLATRLGYLGGATSTLTISPSLARLETWLCLYRESDA